MNYNNNSACLGVLEGAGLLKLTCPDCGANEGKFLKKIHSSINDTMCRVCKTDFKSKGNFLPPTSDQAFEILVKVAESLCGFSFGIDEDCLTIASGIPGMKDWKMQRLRKGPLSQRLIAALAWLVINKPEELRGVVGDLGCNVNKGV